MEKIVISKAQQLNSLNPLALIAVVKNETINLTTISWWTYLSNSPQMLGFSLGAGSYSGELIQKGNRFSLCIPGEDLAEKVMKCGQSSGRNIDKVKEFGIELQQVSEESMLLPRNCRIICECECQSTVEAGNHLFYLCNIKNIWGDSSIRQLFAKNGYSELTVC